MFDVIAGLLAWLYDLWPSFGGSIILLTLAVMLITTPLTLKGTRSMIQMQRLQPEMKAIQERHKGDRPKMNEELMAFYQRNNINPLGGCFPLLVQFPVFIVLYQVLGGLTRRSSDVGQQLGWSASQLLSDTTTTEVASRKQHFNPAYLDQSTDLFKTLSTSNEMPFLGIDLARSARDVLGDSVVTALPYLIMIVVVGLTTYLNQRQIQGRSTSQMNPQQALLLKVMPFFLPVISFSLQASLVVYFLVSNVYRYGQQAYITRNLYGKDDDAPTTIDANSTVVDTKAKGGGKGTSGGKGKAIAASSSSSGKKGSSNKSTAAATDTSGRSRRKSFGDKPSKQPNKSSGQRGRATPSSRVTPKGSIQPRGRKTKKRK